MWRTPRPRRACSSSSRSIAPPPPSLNTKPSRGPCPNGRLASGGPRSVGSVERAPFAWAEAPQPAGGVVAIFRHPPADDQVRITVLGWWRIPPTRWRAFEVVAGGDPRPRFGPFKGRSGSRGARRSCVDDGSPRGTKNGEILARTSSPSSIRCIRSSMVQRPPMPAPHTPRPQRGLGSVFGESR